MADGKPVGGNWNFDAENRQAFGPEGPGHIKPPRRFTPDETTRAVCRLVERRFPDHPGRLDDLDLPVTHEQARAALRDFVKHRLPCFGAYQDAMWPGQPFLYHSRLSTALNLKLLDPRACIAAAEEAYASGTAGLSHVEGFIRQILGWREFVNGVYWQLMPEYASRNALQCEDRKVPACFWTGETHMACVADAMRSVLDHAYAHHIQRLMVLGNFALMLGVHPRRFLDWHMAMYADAVDWVSLPNALGMSQHADGGVVGTKPYCSTGKYIQRMGPYCKECRYNPGKAAGDDACPFTTLYWDFLARHRRRFEKNRRMALQVKNLDRKKDELRAIQKQAGALRDKLDACAVV